MAFDSTNYYQLEWVQSNGAQNIPFAGDSQGNRYEMKICFTNLTATQYVYGYSYSYRHDLLSVTTAGVLRYQVRNSSVTTIATITAGTDHVIETSSLNGNTYAIVDGVRTNITTETGGQVGTNRQLFAYRSNQSAVAGRYTVRVYYFRMYDSNNSMVFEYIPALRKTDQKAGMYDTVSETFIEPSGSENLVYNPLFIPEQFDFVNYDRLEYIQSTGTQYINTTKTQHRYHAYMFDVDMSANSSTSTLFGTVGSSDTGFYFTEDRTNNQYISKERSTAYTVSGLYSKRFVGYQSALSGHFHDIDGGNIKTYTGGSPSSLTMAYPYFIFGKNNSGSLTEQTSAKLYYLEIFNYDTSAYFLKLYPALRKSDGKPGLYDLLTGTFYTNAGTGEFLYPTAGSIWAKVPVNITSIDDLTNTTWAISGSVPSINDTYYIDFTDGLNQYVMIGEDSGHVVICTSQRCDMLPADITIRISGGADVTNANLISWLLANASGTAYEWRLGTPYVKVNGAWKKGTAYIKVSGAWKEGK